MRVFIAVLLCACSGTPAPDAGGLPDAASDAAIDAGSVAPSCAPSSLNGAGEGAWDPSFTVAGLTGFDGFVPAVHALASDTDGALLAAGYFVWAGRDRVGPVARLDGEGAWRAVRPELPSPDFSAIAVDGDHLALASFYPLLPIVGPPPQQGAIYVDTGDGLESIATFTGAVRALEWIDGELWAAGHFTIEGGPSELAVWDGSAWSAPGGATNGPVYTLLVEGDTLIAGGSFTSIGGIEAGSVAAWNGTTWSALSMALEPQGAAGAFQGPVVYGLARGADDVLYAGGIFYAGDQTEGGVARWDGEAWAIVGDGFALSGGISGDGAAVVSDIAVHDGDLYAAGCFTRSGETELPGVARWTGTAWQALAGAREDALGSVWFQSFVCGGEPSGTAIFEAPIQALHSDGERLYVAGAFAGVAGVPSASLIAHDGEQWIAQGASERGLVGGATELAAGDPECGVYAFGGVTHAGEETGALVYRFDGEVWSSVGGARPDDVTCWQLAVSSDGDVYLGCETPFTEVPGVPRVYRLEAGAWRALPDIDAPGGLAVGDMVVDGEVLWVVGGAGDSGFIARLDGDTFTIVEDDIDGTVTRIAFGPDGAFVIGGSFTRVAGVAANGVARFDGAWGALGGGVTTPRESPVSALAYEGDTIYLSTYFGGAGHVVLGRWDGSAWEELGTEPRGLIPHVDPDGAHQILQLFVRGDRVVLAGAIHPETGGRHAFLFDGERFAPLAGGVGAISVDAFAATHDALYFGGFVATAGAGDAMIPSVGIARLPL
jgi:hypothetical protein